MRREVAEEVGLEVHSISYSSSQHWPFPRTSFMLGCHALVSPAHTQVSPAHTQVSDRKTLRTTDPVSSVPSLFQLNVDHTELEDARWFTFHQVTSALQVKGLPRRGHIPPLWLPPKQAIANHLITEWAEHQRSSQKGD